MSSTVREMSPEQRAPDRRTSGRIRQLGSGAGFLTISMMDLLALEDITTAGAWMPDIVFLIASVPALVTLGYFALRGRPSEPESEPEDGSRRLSENRDG